jgi:hypothetical protein
MIISLFNVLRWAHSVMLSVGVLPEDAMPENAFADEMEAVFRSDYIGLAVKPGDRAKNAPLCPLCGLALDSAVDIPGMRRSTVPARWARLFAVCIDEVMRMPPPVRIQPVDWAATKARFGQTIRQFISHSIMSGVCIHQRAGCLESKHANGIHQDDVFGFVPLRANELGIRDPTGQRPLCTQRRIWEPTNDHKPK